MSFCDKVSDHKVALQVDLFHSFPSQREPVVCCVLC